MCALQDDLGGLGGAALHCCISSLKLRSWIAMASHKCLVPLPRTTPSVQLPCLVLSVSSVIKQAAAMSSINWLQHVALQKRLVKNCFPVWKSLPILALNICVPWVIVRQSAVEQSCYAWHRHAPLSSPWWAVYALAATSSNRRQQHSHRYVLALASYQHRTTNRQKVRCKSALQVHFKCTPAPHQHQNWHSC